MKVFNLACRHGHHFEGWFGSAEDYDEQLERGLIECPVCDDGDIRKLLSAPRLNLSGAQAPAADAQLLPVESGPGATGASNVAAPTPQQVQAIWMKLARHLVENTEDVGERFAEEARRIHHQEAPERGIRGVASAGEREALQQEGIEVFAFPLPRSVKDPLQ
jgi:hypothetical protein